MIRSSAVAVGLMALLGTVSLAAGCGGGSTIGTSDGGTSEGGTSSGTSGTSAGKCTELHVGGQNDPGIGGAATSQVAAQAIADYAGAAQAQVSGLTASCKALATSLGVSSANQMAADAETMPRDKAKAWSELAVLSISVAKQKAGGSFTLMATPSACKLSVAQKLACQARCAGTTTCDEAANPVVCTGGTLSGGFCTGGKLEGGCKVDAKCDANCDVSVIAAADCPASPVTMTATGAADPATAAMLKTAIEANLPTVFALAAHFKVEAEVAAILTGDSDALSDIKPACYVQALSAATEAASDVSAGADASSQVLASVQ